MFIVCRFLHTKSPAVRSQTAPHRYRLLHLVCALLPAGPCMVRQLKVHLVSGVAPGRAYCSLPSAGPEAGGAAGRRTSERSGHRCARIRGQKVFLAFGMVWPSRTGRGPRSHTESQMLVPKPHPEDLLSSVPALGLPKEVKNWSWRGAREHR